MIGGGIWGSAPESRLLPIEKLHRPSVSVMAIMTFAMIVVGAASLALSNAAGLVANAVENRYIVVLPAAAAADLPRAAAAARSAAGVVSASPVAESEMRETLERWLGDAASSAELPVPALVTLELAPGTQAAAVEARVQSQVPAAQLVSETAELKPLLRSLHALQWLSVALVALMSLATAAAIVLAARGALDTHRSTVEIMHGIGATDRQLVRLFERKIALDAVAGAGIGAAAAVVTALLIGGAGFALARELSATAPLGPFDLLILALVPVIVVLIAVAVARLTLLKALRETV